jgi:hypothetical protein
MPRKKERHRAQGEVFSLDIPFNRTLPVTAFEKVLYDLLFRTSAETLLEVARNPRHLGAEIGFFSVLHTWSQKLSAHPHVHCVVPAGGLSPDHSHWIRSRDNYFLPKEVLQEVFRAKFVNALKQAFRMVSSTSREISSFGLSPRSSLRGCDRSIDKTGSCT